MSIALQLSNIHAHLGARHILHGIELNLREGAVLGLVGPNGSGKSTLIRCITGAILPSLGEVLIATYHVQHAPLLARQHLGFAPDPNALPSALTVRQCLSLCITARTGSSKSVIPDATMEQAQRLGLNRYLDSFISTLSLGTKQKVAILIGLMQAPSLLVLDEVFNGLDPKSAYVLKQILRELSVQGCAIVLATHGLELAADLLSEMVLLSEGRVAAHWQEGAFQELRAGGAAKLEEAIVRALESEIAS
jgi:ABC-2 type transport system ATP-binding protein